MNEARPTTAPGGEPPHQASSGRTYLNGERALRRWGHPARDIDFIIPGDLAGAQHGVRDPRTGACHATRNQAGSWGARCFSPAVTKAAEHPELFNILGATPYALRRGGISLRLRAEDPQTVASECGTSLQMLSDHYAYAIQDLRQHGPRPADVEWRAARAAIVRSHEEDPSASIKTPDHGGGERRRKSLFAWLSHAHELLARSWIRPQQLLPVGRQVVAFSSPQDVVDDLNATGACSVRYAGNRMAPRAAGTSFRVAALARDSGATRTIAAYPVSIRCAVARRGSPLRFSITHVSWLLLVAEARAVRI